MRSCWLHPALHIFCAAGLCVSLCTPVMLAMGPGRLPSSVCLASSSCEVAGCTPHCRSLVQLSCAFALQAPVKLAMGPGRLPSSVCLACSCRSGHMGRAHGPGLPCRCLVCRAAAQSRSASFWLVGMPSLKQPPRLLCRGSTPASSVQTCRNRTGWCAGFSRRCAGTAGVKLGADTLHLPGRCSAGLHHAVQEVLLWLHEQGR